MPYLWSWNLAESHISGHNLFGILLNLLRISETWIYDSRNLIHIATNLFLICPHHFHPSSAELSDTEQKNNKALPCSLCRVTCYQFRSGMNSCHTLLFRPFWLKHSFFSLAESCPSPLPMTAVQNAGKLLVLWASFCSAGAKSIHWSRTCWWGHTVNYLLLTGFICPYLNIQCHHFYPWLLQPWFSHRKRLGFIVPYYVLSNLVSTSNYNLPVLFLVWGSLK